MRNCLLPNYFLDACYAALISMHGTLQIVVQILGWIQFRWVRKQMEHLDLFFVFEPRLDRLAAIDPQVVEDQNHLTANIPHQSFHELDEALAVQGIVIEHESKLCSIVDCRDHAEMFFVGI